MSSAPSFDRDRWRALSSYLDEALEMSREHRARWLTGICARDPVVGADLEALLAEHDHLQDSRFLERTVPLLRHLREPLLRLLRP